MPGNQDISGDGILRDDLGRYVPGSSGNPSGKPPGTRSLTAILRRLLDSRLDPNDPDNLRTNGEEMIHAAIHHAHCGNSSFFKEILERMDGKIPERIEAKIGGNWETIYEEESGQDVEDNASLELETNVTPAPSSGEDVDE